MISNINSKMASSLDPLLSALLTEFQEPSTWREVRDPQVIFRQSQYFQPVFSMITQNPDQIPLVLDRIGASLNQLDPLKACCIAHFCGALIEQGAVRNIGAAGRAMVDFFGSIVIRSCEYLLAVEKDLGTEELDAQQVSDWEARKEASALFSQSPDLFRAYHGCELLTLAVMQAIARDAECRIRLRELGILDPMKYLQGFLEVLYYPLTVHDACSQFPLILLIPAAKKGFLAVANDLSNCFHLFTLLEAELFCIGQAEACQLKEYPYSQELHNIAKGNIIPQFSQSIQAHQQYYTWKALQKNGSLQALLGGNGGKQLDPQALVWGEMPPEAIPQIDGRAVILMDQKGMFGGRSWDVSFISKCHDALSPFVQIEKELSQKEFSQWMKRIHSQKDSTRML